MGTDSLELFLNDAAGTPLKSLQAAADSLKPRQRRLLFGMNAGMYHGNLAPVGLFISEGKQLSPLNLGSAFGNFFLKPNGVFAVIDGKAVICESSRFPRFKGAVSLATQSGPLLVEKGRIHPAFKKDSTSRLFRNGVGVPSPGIAYFAITEEPLNLYEFAILFRDGLHCPDALYFDGTVSSIYAPSLKRNDRKIDLGPMIGITEPQMQVDAR